MIMHRNYLSVYYGQDDITKWMINARRERMLTSNLDMVLRIYCNSPERDDKAALTEWLMEVAKIFWTDADRDIACDELDDICNKI